jgi:glycosyltransferase involved in cell wall biosynthesis
MSDKILSIVIPSYNMESLLPRCLDSLYVPDISEKIEVLIVNDGSKDDTLNVALKYSKQHPECFKVVDKQNGNYGSCINTGLALATGKYFRILDADDYFRTNSLVKLVAMLEKQSNDIDVIFTNVTYCYPQSQRTIALNTKYLEYNKKYSFINLDFASQHNNQMLSMHSITYNLSLLKKVGLRHQEGISYTDIEYCFFPLTQATNITFYDIDLYQYVQDREGQTMSIKSLLKSKSHLLKVSSRLIEYLSSLHLDNTSILNKNLSHLIEHPLFNYCMTSLIFEDKSNFSKEEFNSIYNKISRIPYLLKIVNNFTYKKFPFVNFYKYLNIKPTFLKRF